MACGSITVTILGIALLPKEAKALEELSNQLDLSQDRVMIQALRLYQAVHRGGMKVVEVDPMPRMPPDVRCCCDVELE